MVLTSTSPVEKEISVGETVLLKLNLAFETCKVFKKQGAEWKEKTVFSTADMSLNDFIIYLERLEEKVKSDEVQEKKFEIVQ